MKKHILFIFVLVLLLTSFVFPTFAQDKTIITVANAAQVAPIATLEGHTGAVNTVAFSPDGKLLASGGDDTTVRLWDVATVKQSLVLKGHTSSVNSLAFNPDGTVLAAGGDMLHLAMVAWNTQTGRNLAQFDICASLKKEECDFMRSFYNRDKPGRITAVVYIKNDLSPGQGTPFFGWGEIGTNVIWFVDNNAGQMTQTDTRYDFTSEVFSRDQSFRISGRSDGLGTYVVSSQAENETIVSPKPVSSLALFADSSLATGGFDGKINLFSVSLSGNQVKITNNGTLDGHSAKVTGVAFSPDGTLLVSSSLDGTLRLWDVKAQKEIATLSAPNGVKLNAVAFSPDGTLIASAGSDGIVRLWGVPTSQATPEATSSVTAQATPMASATAVSPAATALAHEGTFAAKPGHWEGSNPTVSFDLSKSGAITNFAINVDVVSAVCKLTFQGQASVSANGTLVLGDPTNQTVPEYLTGTFTSATSLHGNYDISQCGQWVFLPKQGSWTATWSG